MRRVLDMIKLAPNWDPPEDQLANNGVECCKDESTTRRVIEDRNRSRRVAKEIKSIPLLSRLFFSLHRSMRTIGISSTSCCTFRGRAQPIFGDYSVSHPVSNLFSSRPASSKHTKREEENSLQGTGASETLTSCHFHLRHGWSRECRHQHHWHLAQSPCGENQRWLLAWMQRKRVGELVLQRWQH